MTPKVNLKAALSALLMHEVAHQNCADEKLAKEVERYYSSESVQQMLVLRSVSSTFDNIRGEIENLRAALDPDKYGHRYGKPEEEKNDQQICSMIGAAYGSAQSLEWEIKSMGDYTDRMFIDLRLLFTDAQSFCGDAGYEDDSGYVAVGDRQALLKRTDKAIVLFDNAANYVTEKFGNMIWNFSTRQWPH